MAHPNPVAAAVLATIFLGIPATASAQGASASSQSGDAAQTLASLPLESPAITEMAARARSQTIERDIPREIRQARFDRQRRESLQATADAFQKLAAEHKQDLAVTLVNHKRITGRVLSANADGFIIRARFTHQETTLRHSEVSEWRVVPTAGSQALETTVLVLLAIPMIPLVLLAGLAGWDGC